MANVFKNYIANSVGTSPVGLTCSSGVITIIGMTICNSNPSGTNVLATSYIGSQYITYNSILVPKSTLVLVGGDQKLVLEAGDSILTYSDTIGALDIIISYMQTT